MLMTMSNTLLWRLDAKRRPKINPTTPSRVTGAASQAQAGLIPKPSKHVISGLTIVWAADTHRNLCYLTAYKIENTFFFFLKKGARSWHRTRLLNPETKMRTWTSVGPAPFAQQNCVVTLRIQTRAIGSPRMTLSWLAEKSMNRRSWWKMNWETTACSKHNSETDRKCVWLREELLIYYVGKNRKSCLVSMLWEK